MIKIIKITAIVLIIFANNSNANSQNKIILTLNDKIFTTIDLNKKKNYLRFKQNLDLLDNDEVLNEFININIYSEFYEKNKRKINEQDVESLYMNLLNQYLVIDNNSIEKLNINISKKEILKNIKKELKKKEIIESILNNKRAEIFQNDFQNLETLYNYNIELFTIKISELNKLEKIVKNIIFNEINDKIKEIRKNNINIFYENREIKKIKNLNKKIQYAIQSNQKEFYFENNDIIYIGKIIKRLKEIKKLELFIFQINTEIQYSTKDLKCNKIEDFKKNSKNSVKEIKQNYMKLNNKLKENLNSIDDNITFLNQTDNEFIYFILCNIKYDQEKYKNIKIQNKIKYLVNEIDKDFIYINSKKLRFKYKLPNE